MNREIEKLITAYKCYRGILVALIVADRDPPLS
jgi:hypothetical protein